MLRIKSNGSWQDVGGASLAELIVEGKVGGSTLTIDSAVNAPPQPLESVLRAPDLELVGWEVLNRVKRLYDLGPEGADAGWLRERVNVLKAWSWDERQSHVLRERLLWLSAFLADLTGDIDAAVRLYGLYLSEERDDWHLRVLAANNRGVLLIRDGLAEGIGDLAGAVIRLDPVPPGGNYRPNLLPAGAFNLVNVLNVCVGNDALCLEVDRALRRYATRVKLSPAEFRAWFGWTPKQPPRSESEDEEGGGRGFSARDLEPLIYRKPRQAAAFVALLGINTTGFAPNPPAAS